MTGERSPYDLFQERLRDERPPHWQWRMLVMCKMVNLSTAAKAHEVAAGFFLTWPSPDIAARADLSEMVEALRPLGLQNRRAASIIRMSSEFLWSRAEVEELYGVGKYAADSWKIFVEGKTVEDVKDGKLRLYVDWARGRGRSGAGGDTPGSNPAERTG